MVALLGKMIVFLSLAAGLLVGGCGDGDAQKDALKSVVNVYLNGLQGESWSAAESAWSRHTHPVELEIRKASQEAIFEALDLEYKVESFDVMRLDETIASAQVVCAVRKKGGSGVFTDERVTSFYTFVRSDARAPWRILGCEDIAREVILDKTEQ